MASDLPKITYLNCNILLDNNKYKYDHGISNFLSEKLKSDQSTNFVVNDYLEYKNYGPMKIFNSFVIHVCANTSIEDRSFIVVSYPYVQENNTIKIVEEKLTVVDIQQWDTSQTKLVILDCGNVDNILIDTFFISDVKYVMLAPIGSTEISKIFFKEFYINLGLSSDISNSFFIADKYCKEKFDSYNNGKARLFRGKSSNELTQPEEPIFPISTPIRNNEPPKIYIDTGKGNINTKYTKMLYPLSKDKSSIFARLISNKKTTFFLQGTHTIETISRKIIEHGDSYCKCVCDIYNGYGNYIDGELIYGIFEFTYDSGSDQILVKEFPQEIVKYVGDNLEIVGYR